MAIANWRLPDYVSIQHDLWEFKKHVRVRHKNRSVEFSVHDSVSYDEIRRLCYVHKHELVRSQQVIDKLMS